MFRATNGQRSWLGLGRASDGEAAPGRRLLRLDADRLLAAASRGTGLDDFGDPSFREPLARLVGSLESEAQLNVIGRIAARGEIAGMLTNRLLLERDRR